MIAVLSALSKNRSVHPLGLAVRNGQLEEKVGLLEKEDLTFVKDRVMKKLGWTLEHAEDVRVEFLRFIALTFVNRGMHAPSVDVDEFWHAFLLFTKEYQEFCQRHHGEFIHHVPEHSSAAGVVDMTLLASQTCQLIKELFPSYSREIWNEQGICSKGGPTSSKNCGVIVPYSTTF